MSAPMFEVRGATVTRSQRALLDDVSLTVEAGEVLAVMGENGAGKSTLLKLLAGDFAPDRGTILLDGRPLDEWSMREQALRRAVMPQQTSLAFAFSAFEVVMLGRLPHDQGRPGAVDRLIAREAMRRTDVLTLVDRSYPTLSGGERARVMLARALAQVMGGDEATGASRGPKALLLDEPSAALDIAHQQTAFAMIRDLAQHEGIAVVAVLHDPNLAMRFADRAALFRQGRLLALGPIETTMTEDALSACFSIPMRRVSDATMRRPIIVVAA